MAHFLPERQIDCGANQAALPQEALWRVQPQRASRQQSSAEDEARQLRRGERAVLHREQQFASQGQVLCPERGGRRGRG